MDIPAEISCRKYKVDEQLMTFSDMAALEEYQDENPNAYVRNVDVRKGGVIQAQMWHIEEVKMNEKTV
ncbi:hypothetical protein J42TS3_37890 [Paenibacillus vini]|uniref:Uncharacterized protein n=2 Tax=Paenibacillus vini TaxID=1476024 RepID=A0ABQ4MFI5_9BACL|nr:hypothetical protein J42TS3_37890 [Paenibacillus vini]